MSNEESGGRVASQPGDEGIYGQANSVPTTRTEGVDGGATSSATTPKDRAGNDVNPPDAKPSEVAVTPPQDATYAGAEGRGAANPDATNPGPPSTGPNT